MHIHADKLIGKSVYDEGLQRVGTISHLYLDHDSHQPAWVTVRRGFFGSKESFVPLSLTEMDEMGPDVVVRTDKDIITDSPGVRAKGTLTAKEQALLYNYYRQKANIKTEPRSRVLEESTPKGLSA